ncbi:hypothetical protein LOK49_LG10G02452 [Camellia lanceoleosa]|uniref:Uncharacterized protein n=1 Tax=Camellia lanceoleosa TaxID=1840588 RepID=A0ACC0GA06_9ERIC|nr:hypothetical protein LOK49_LG10G02452 [Camellia lanceoleosa]
MQYRFFLNKEYGSLFSSLMTGLYLTFKLTSVVEKVQSFFAALKALSRKESHYGAYATSEQDNWWRQTRTYVQPIGRTASATSALSVLDGQGDSRSDRGVGESGSQSLNGDGEAVDGAGSNSRDSSYQRYDIQQAARWIEQVLPFSLLLLVVSILMF